MGNAQASDSAYDGRPTGTPARRSVGRGAPFATTPAGEDRIGGPNQNDVTSEDKEGRLRTRKSPKTLVLSQNAQNKCEPTPQDQWEQLHQRSIIPRPEIRRGWVGRRTREAATGGVLPH